MKYIMLMLFVIVVGCGNIPDKPDTLGKSIDSLVVATKNHLLIEELNSGYSNALMQSAFYLHSNRDSGLYYLGVAEGYSESIHTITNWK